MECLSFCLAQSIDLNQMEPWLIKDRTLHCLKLRQLIKFHRTDNPSIMGFLFKNGTLVTWGYKRYEAKRLVSKIKRHCQNPIKYHPHDEFSYRLGDETTIKPHEYFDVDCLTLEEDNEDIKLSLSYGFSQSVKLQYFESRLEGLIDKYTPMIGVLSNTGKMHISRKQTRKIIGEILATKSEMNLISNFMYHPKYFWQHPSLELYFTMLEGYLDIARRIHAINHRLDTLNEIFDMFSGYLENKHSHSLEIIIIVLIAVEIVLGILNIHI
ncbi:RMD1 family protein [Legionella sp. W05-934-2]|jgi:uncharacterized Rmd1/YagE family protein|uniref:RMD1 family protein n=1 Tax=Legionella sp. W05-934-2 TaxID=1198649 RepID=UPI003462F2AB